MCFDNGGATQTATETNTPPSWLQELQKWGANNAQTQAQPFTQVSPYSIAGTNTDQDAVANGWRDLYIDTQNQNPLQMGQAGTTMAKQVQLSPDEIKQFQNPYNQQVLDTTYRNMRQQYDTQDANLGARMAAAGSYGGSREAVQRSMQGKSFQDGVASTAANLMAQGFDKASALASANAQMRQQTELANAAAANGMASGNAGRQQSAVSDWQNRMVQAMQGLQATGDNQQKLQQSVIDAPWTALQKYASLVPGYTNVGGTSTKVTPDNTPSPFMQILGLAASLGGSYLKSDETTKTNIDKLGKDPKTGLDVISYDDKADVARAKEQGTPMPPKRVSVIAQDVEKMDPKAVKKVGKTKVVSTKSLYDMIQGG